MNTIIQNLITIIIGFLVAHAQAADLTTLNVQHRIIIRQKSVNTGVGEKQDLDVIIINESPDTINLIVESIEDKGRRVLAWDMTGTKYGRIEGELAEVSNISSSTRFVDSQVKFTIKPGKAVVFKNAISIVPFEAERHSPNNELIYFSFKLNINGLWAKTNEIVFNFDQTVK